MKKLDLWAITWLGHTAGQQKVQEFGTNSVTPVPWDYLVKYDKPSPGEILQKTLNGLYICWLESYLCCSLVLYQICKLSELLNLWFSHPSSPRPNYSSLMSWLPDPHLFLATLNYWLPSLYFQAPKSLAQFRPWHLSGSLLTPYRPNPSLLLTTQLHHRHSQGRGWHFLLKPSQSSRTFANQATTDFLAFRSTPEWSNTLCLLRERITCQF